MIKTNEFRLIDANALCEGLVSNHPVVIAAKCAPVITLNTLRDEVYQDAVVHGLWERTDYTVELIRKTLEREDDLFDPNKIMRGWAMQVIRFEVDELEASEEEDEYVEELADVIIAALSVAGKLDIDIDAAVKRKMEINKGRPWKHGKEDA